MKELSKEEQEALIIINTQVDKVLSLLHDHLKKFCDDTKGTNIPMYFIEHSIKVIKENYRKGAERSMNEP